MIAICAFRLETLDCFLCGKFKEYAEKFVSSMSNGHKCNFSKLNLEEFSDKIVDYLCESGMSIGVFPVAESDYGKIINVNTFAEDLSVELENYQ